MTQDEAFGVWSLIGWSLCFVAFWSCFWWHNVRELPEPESKLPVARLKNG